MYVYFSVCKVIELFTMYCELVSGTSEMGSRITQPQKMNIYDVRNLIIGQSVFIKIG